MAIKITVIRHAPTEYNIKGIFMGSKDILPATFDEELIQSVGEKIKEYNYSKMYVSPLQRAYLTALAINDNYYELFVDERLRERTLGEWEGCTKEDIQKEFPYAFNNGIMDFYFTPPKGEEYEKMITRISNFLQEIYSKNENVVIVTHNGVFRVMKSLITGDYLSNVFSKFEPYLTPVTLELTDEIMERICQNPFYTVDLKKSSI